MPLLDLRRELRAKTLEIRKYETGEASSLDQLAKLEREKQEKENEIN